MISCNFKVANNTQNGFVVASVDLANGDVSPNPPLAIQPGASDQSLFTPTGHLRGAQGSVTYAVDIDGSQTFTLTWYLRWDASNNEPPTLSRSGTGQFTVAFASPPVAPY